MVDLGSGGEWERDREKEKLSVMRSAEVRLEPINHDIEIKQTKESRIFMHTDFCCCIKPKVVVNEEIYV